VVNSPITVTVECYSGYTFAERPIAFLWDGRRHRVERVLKRWRSPDGPGFRVLTAAGAQFELIYGQARDEWTLYIPPGSETPPQSHPEAPVVGRRASTDGENPLSNNSD